MQLTTYLTRYQLHLILLIGVIVSAVIVFGILFFPEIFYDQWIWKYYWGPVVADAQGFTAYHNGVAAYPGYTMVSELTYGVLLLIALYGIYQLLKKLQISIDWWFCLALLPYILFGPVTRVLEDAEFFSPPLIYWFISPLIYLQIAVYAILFILLGYVVQKKNRSSFLSIWRFMSIILILANGIYIILWILNIPVGTYQIHPLVFLLLTLCSQFPLLLRYYQQKNPSINDIVFTGGLFILLPAAYLIVRWISGFEWGVGDVRFDVFALVIGIVSILVLLVYLVGRKYQDNPAFAPYTNPLNLALLVGHLIDGITSYISIYDPLQMGLPSYIEKHPGSNFLMEVWPPLFPIVKFLLILGIIYLFDVSFKKEVAQYQRLINLLKIGILILGFSPGLRDLLRVTMGV